MANPSKRKGTAWESRRAEWWRSLGFTDAHRIALHGSADRGDVFIMDAPDGSGPIVEECKNCRTVTVPAWLREADDEAENAGALACAVAWKIPGVGMGDPGVHPAALRSAGLAAILLAWRGDHDAQAAKVMRLQAANEQLRERRFYQ